MLRSNKVNLIIAILSSILLWVYVVGFVDPQTNGRVTGVPVQFVNGELLAEEDLALVDPGEITVDVSVRGDRSDVRKVESGDILVTADLSRLTLGDNKVELDVATPSKLEFRKISMETVNVKVDSLVTQDFPVEILYDGDWPKGKSEPKNVLVEPETISVAGAASSLRNIRHLRVKISTNKASRENSVYNIKPVPVDKDNEEVRFVWLGTDEVTLTFLEEEASDASE